MSENIKVGDKVEWTTVKRSGKSIHFKQNYGTIVELLPREDRAVVKSGRKQGGISLNKLHLTGSGPNQLTKLIHEMGAR